MTKIRTVVVVLVLLSVGIGGYFFVFSANADSPFSIPNLRFSFDKQQEEKKSNAPVVPTGWKQFQNVQYSFSVYMPPQLTGNIFDEGGGAHTFTFEDVEGAQGFQVFVVPYNETTISEERFRMDNPSGIRKEPVDVVIGGLEELGGVRAVTFFSENPIMGETREVWFIRGNYLYEVTTYKSFDAWLSGIMNTWRFFE
jgi:hypothetical protein